MLANEQVENGLCERCGARVEQRLLEQWFFRITDYAERLLHNLEWIDWSESTKSAQRNWLGRSEGAEISFAIAESDAPPVVVFTTRPDTIFGATYLVLAPEHPQVAALTTANEREQGRGVSRAHGKAGCRVAQDGRERREDGCVHGLVRDESGDG